MWTEHSWTRWIARNHVLPSRCPSQKMWRRIRRFRFSWRVTGVSTLVPISQTTKGWEMGSDLEFSFSSGGSKPKCLSPLFPNSHSTNHLRVWLFPHFSLRHSRFPRGHREIHSWILKDGRKVTCGLTDSISEDTGISGRKNPSTFPPSWSGSVSMKSSSWKWFPLPRRWLSSYWITQRIFCEPFYFHLYWPQSSLPNEFSFFSALWFFNHSGDHPCCTLYPNHSIVSQPSQVSEWRREKRREA